MSHLLHYCIKVDGDIVFAVIRHGIVLQHIAVNPLLLQWTTLCLAVILHLYIMTHDALLHCSVPDYTSCILYFSETLNGNALYEMP